MKFTMILNEISILKVISKITIYLKELLKVGKDKQYDIEIKKHRNKRSLDANAYCWVLCDMIAKELSKDGTIVTKDIVYKDAILQIGTFVPEIWEIKNFERQKEMWEEKGLGFLVEEVAKKNNCVKVHKYYGSSTYNTKEMSLLIEILIELAKSLNLETRPKEEVNSLLEVWK